MKLAYAILAEAAYHSTEEGLTIIGGEKNSFSVKEFPGTTSRLAMVVKLVGEEENLCETLIRIELIDFSKKILAVLLEQSIRLPEQPSAIIPSSVSVYLVGQLNGAVFPEPGEYRISLFLNGNRVDTIQFWAIPFGDRRKSELGMPQLEISHE